MKLISTGLMLGILSCIVSCREDGGNSTFSARPEVNRAFTSGTWHIDFEDTAQTNGYAAYGFRFMRNNTVMAEDGGKKYFGKWYVVSGDATDDEPAHDAHFTIVFSQGTPNKIGILSGNYTVMQHTASMLQLLPYSATAHKMMAFKKNK